MRVSSRGRRWLRFVEWFNAKCNSASMRLTKLLGKSPQDLHPKHLLQQEPWYLEYIKAGDRVLDLGCGSGIHSRRATAKGAMVVSVDKAHPSLPTETFFYVDLENLTNWVRPGLYDVVLLLDVLEHIHNRERLLREIRRALKPTGILLLSVPNSDTTRKRRLRQAGLRSYADADHKIEYTIPSLLEQLDGWQVFGPAEEVIVYDSPWAGLMALVGGFSLPAYKLLMARKRRLVRKHPGETTGWRLALAYLPKPEAEGEKGGLPRVHGEDGYG